MNPTPNEIKEYREKKKLEYKSRKRHLEKKYGDDPEKLRMHMLILKRKYGKTLVPKEKRKRAKSRANKRKRKSQRKKK